MSAAKIKNVELTFFMDSLLESFCPKSAIAKPFGISRCMLRASTEKQSEKSTARNAEGRNLRFLLLPCIFNLMCLSFDHLVCSSQYVRRNCQAHFLRCLQIDYQFKLGRLFHR